MDTTVAEDDPAAYEHELAQREAELGPDHPDVAETLSNLAILYNQQGEYGKAQPLYERALAIWEQSQGPDSSDVAHTLTDLAVLHLENGRDDLGRPLLERALEIQIRNLGEDHPDVVAIKEVLESED
jgi:centrosomal protein CEP104